jgi:hypothetical protein
VLAAHVLLELGTALSEIGAEHALQCLIVAYVRVAECAGAQALE